MRAILLAREPLGELAAFVVGGLRAVGVDRTAERARAAVGRHEVIGFVRADAGLLIDVPSHLEHALQIVEVVVERRAVSLRARQRAVVAPAAADRQRRGARRRRPWRATFRRNSRSWMWSLLTMIALTMPPVSCTANET